MTRIQARLGDARVCRAAALVVLVYFAAEWVVSASWRGFYGYGADLLGPLGAAFCGPDGTWPCSDLFRAMNVALVVTGLAVAVVAASLRSRGAVDRGPALLLAAAGLALAASGVVTVQVDYRGNLAAISAFLVLGSASALLLATSTTSALTADRRAVAVLGGLAGVVGTVAFTSGLSVLGPGGAQRLAVYGILVAVIAVGTARVPTPAVDHERLEVPA